MGCYLSFRGSLEIRPPISEADKELFRVFSEEMSFPTNPKANYMSPWFINDEGRVECHMCKYFEHDRWMEYLYDKFFEPRGYDVFGSILYSGEGDQTEWSVLRYDNGKVFHVRMENIHIDLDFWKMGAEYAKKRMEEIRQEYPDQFITPDISEPDPEQYGGLFIK